MEDLENVFLVFCEIYKMVTSNGEQLITLEAHQRELPSDFCCEFRLQSLVHPPQYSSRTFHRFHEVFLLKSVYPLGRVFEIVIEAMPVSKRIE